MPSSSSARMTRTAISPRLATRTFENMGRGMLAGSGCETPRQHLREACGDEQRLPGELAPGDADDEPAVRREARVACPVVLEGSPGAVGLPAVRLDDYAVVG